MQPDATPNIQPGKKQHQRILMGMAFMLAAGTMGQIYTNNAWEKVGQTISAQAVRNHPLRRQFTAECAKTELEKQGSAIASSYAANPETPIVLDREAIEHCVDGTARRNLISKSPDLPEMAKFGDALGLMTAAGLLGTTLMGVGYLLEYAGSDRKKSDGPNLGR
jgi:hypothetical protein